MNTALATVNVGDTPLQTWMLAAGSGLTILIVAAGATLVWWCASRRAGRAFQGDLDLGWNSDEYQDEEGAILQTFFLSFHHEVER